MSKSVLEYKGKNAISELAKNIQRVVPLVEEITKAKTLPLALIGFSANAKSKLIRSWFATISNDEGTEAALLEICRQLLIAKSIPDPTTAIETLSLIRPLAFADHSSVEYNMEEIRKILNNVK